MASRHQRGTGEVLRSTLMTLALLVGAALPAAIAVVLVATSDGENPLDRVPDYYAPLQETLTIPFDAGEPVRTRYQYHNRVRLFIEGAGQAADGTYRDAFYRYADAQGQPFATPQPALSVLEVDGVPAPTAFGLEDGVPPYAPDHLYAVIYPRGGAFRRIALSLAGETLKGGDGQLTVTVIQLE